MSENQVWMWTQNNEIPTLSLFCPLCFQCDVVFHYSGLFSRQEALKLNMAGSFRSSLALLLRVHQNKELLFTYLYLSLCFRDHLCNGAFRVHSQLMAEIHRQRCAPLRPPVRAAAPMRPHVCFLSSVGERIPLLAQSVTYVWLAHVGESAAHVCAHESQPPVCKSVVFM